MRLWAVVISCVLVLGGSLRGLAQQSTGPATLEGRLNSGETQEAATPAEQETGPKRPAGMHARPKEGVRHPDLDKAWADYDSAVAKVTESIRAAIGKQFDAATDKGDLAAAEKWQVALEKFEKADELPTEKETKAAASAAATDAKQAREELTKAYEAVVKSLTTEKKIAEAKRVRDELLLACGNKQGDGEPQEVFLSDLQAQNVGVGFGVFGTNGNLGYLEGRQIAIQGKPSPKGLSMHPPTKGASRAIYNLPKGFAHFEATVGIDDSAAIQRTPVVFKVFGDNRVIWTSRPIQGAGQSQDCHVGLRGAKLLTLVVECPGDRANAHAVWCEPRLTTK